jgi:hypothetical protein
MNEVLEMTWKETIVAYSRYHPAFACRDEKKFTKTLVRIALEEPRIEPNIF